MPLLPLSFLFPLSTFLSPLSSLHFPLKKFAYLPENPYLCTKNTSHMKRNALLPLLLLLVASLTACLDKQPRTMPSSPLNPSPSTLHPHPSTLDSSPSTLYGLVCDGSNDTLLIFLRDPYDGTDPDTLNILDASRRHRVFGTLRIGDRVAILPDTACASCASTVIVTQDLLGQWCYRVTPTLRRRAGMEQRLQADAALSDSVSQLLSQEREYGINIKADSVAMPIGMRSADADVDSPVEYPVLPRYRRWAVSGDRLLLTRMTLDSLGNAAEAVTDTATFLLLTPDSLVLLFPEGPRAYYRKSGN